MHRRTSAKIHHQSRSEGPFLQARLSKVHQALLRSEPPVPAFRCLRQQKASKLLTRDPLAGLLDKATLDTSLKDCHTKPLFCGQAAASNKDNQPPGKASEQKDHLSVSYSTSQVSSQSRGFSLTQSGKEPELPLGGNARIASAVSAGHGAVLKDDNDCEMLRTKKTNHDLNSSAPAEASAKLGVQGASET